MKKIDLTEITETAVSAVVLALTGLIVETAIIWEPNPPTLVRILMIPLATAVIAMAIVWERYQDGLNSGKGEK